MEGLVLSEYDYFAPQTDWHYHENPYFMYVLDGDMHDVNHHGKTAIGAGSLVFHNWQEPHQNTKESNYGRGFHLELERSWFDNKKLDLELWEGSQIIQNPFLHHLLAKIYAEFHRKDTFSELALEILLLQLCEGLQGQQPTIQPSAPDWVKPLKALIWESNEVLSLQYLSDQLGIHPVHLSRAIPKYLATNLGDYIRQQRVKQSLPLVINSSMSLTEIAHHCGFSDQSHFTRIFKRYFDQTPNTFRKQLLTC